MVQGPLVVGCDVQGLEESEASILGIFLLFCKEDKEEPAGTQVAGHGNAPKPDCAYLCPQES